MRVIKVLNNSLVLALDNAGQESILMGKGIGFHKSIGYEFQESEIEKVFVLKDKEVSRNIIRLAAETDSVFFELAKAVIDYAIEQFDMKLMDHIYLSLTDHLSFAARPGTGRHCSAELLHAGNEKIQSSGVSGGGICGETHAGASGSGDSGG